MVGSCDLRGPTVLFLSFLTPFSPSSSSSSLLSTPIPTCNSLHTLPHPSFPPFPSPSPSPPQYPEWLSQHKDRLSKEDYLRYSKQLEVMTAICQEFEKEGQESEGRGRHFDRVLELMQQVRVQCTCTCMCMCVLALTFH